MPTREEVRETIADAVLEAWANLPPRKASSAEYADEIIKALTAAGYAIVPVEPTEAMINACERAWHSGEHRPQYLYKAMLAASERKIK